MSRTGRPRQFDIDSSTEAAMLLFWENGYEATSLAQLRKCMSLSSASFYAAFGSKDGAFNAAVRRYMESYGRVTLPLADDDLEPREALEKTLRASVVMQTDSAHPLGCLIGLGGIIAGTDEKRRAALQDAENLRPRQRCKPSRTRDRRRETRTARGRRCSRNAASQLPTRIDPAGQRRGERRHPSSIGHRDYAVLGFDAPNKHDRQSLIRPGCLAKLTSNRTNAAGPSTGRGFNREWTPLSTAMCSRCASRTAFFRWRVGAQKS